ncbi:SRPBCC family protein [Streptomyces sp. SID5643]|uniref:SRPBCC family protein n=1 Tax=Streptomyces sp. SID5643 TaxID=2690307 RepID=UPI0013714E6F|nr:SRPBCC family protein [Streptomyces sp. SID5643]MZF88126.1 SRPBCC family protein [Streptomyces sp. SID5643]
MPRRLRPVELDFVTTAPVRHAFERDMAAVPEAVYGALEDVPGWAEWFAQVSAARPVGAGAGRDITLTGGIRFRETVIAAKGPELYAYRVDVTNLPGVRAIAEEWRLTPAGSGTRLRWTFATDGTAAYRLAVKVARGGQARAFRDAVRALDRRLKV